MKGRFILLFAVFSLIVATPNAIQSSSAAVGQIAASGASVLSNPFDDDFNSSTLDRKWYWIRETPTHWSILASPGYLRMITQRKDIWRDSNSAPLLLQSLGPFTGDNFGITTRVLMTPTANFHQGGLVVYDDDDNYVRFTYAYIDGPTFEFAKEIGGSFQPIQVAAPPNASVVHLRIEKLGVNYHGYYSKDGENWTLIGVHENVDISPSEIGLLAFNGRNVTSIEIPVDFDYFHVTSTCEIPFFSQRDEKWAKHPLRTDGICSPYCGKIGTCGCALTSAAMVFGGYGSAKTPPDLSDCMNTRACPFDWVYADYNCNEGTTDGVSWPKFSYEALDTELNQNHRFVIVEMCKRGTCHFDYDGDPSTSADTHFVTVTSGSGTDPEYYLMHDPWYKCGANIPLATRWGSYEFRSMRVYRPALSCSSLSAPIPPCVPPGANPQPAASGQSTSQPVSSPWAVTGPEGVAAASVISGTAWLYTRTQLTMTVELEATSSEGDVTDMRIWSDTLTNTRWQPYTRFVWLPVSEFVYARFRDSVGNVTGVYSDTTEPVGPPDAIREVYLPLARR